MCPGGYPIVATQNWRSCVPARVLPGHVHQHAARQCRQADREYPQRTRHARRAATAAQPGAPGSTTARRSSEHDDPALEARSSRSSWPTACRSEASDAFDIRRSRESIRCTYTARYPGPTAHDHSPAARARCAVRSGLEWRRPALGRSRRPAKHHRQLAADVGSGHSPHS